MKKIYLEDSSFQVCEFTPSIFNLVKKDCILKLKLLTKFLFIIKYLSGYKVYYAYYDNKPVYYCIISFGYFLKHPYVKNNEILVGPYYTKDEMRGKGFATLSLKIILDYINYQKAYIFIKKDNTASIKTALKCGFEFCSYGGYKGLFSIFRLSNNSDNNNYIVYTKEKQ